MRWMRLMMASVLALGAIGFVHAASPTPAFACSCVPLDTKQQAEAAQLVAKASVRSVSEAGQADGAAATVYTVDLASVWKGDAQARIDVLTPQRGESCGVEGLAPGSTIVLFAAKSDTMGNSSPSWHTNLCSGTGQADPQVVDELTALLGNPTAPPPGPPTEPPETTDDGEGQGRMLGAIALVGLSALGAGAVAWWRRTPGARR